ncbi:MAG: serine/threonine-protein kinase, partial [Polyangiaceae bacterium]
REVARGGAGAVYEAEDRELGRRVALKIYHDDHRGHAQLAHEARVAAELAGAGVVRVLDVDLDHAWLAIEWAQGGSLRDAIRAKNGAIVSPIDRWALPLSRTLARVHAHGWAHLDVKPANVLFDARSVPMLGDFGIAQKIGATAAPGSMGFVSPERLAGEPASASDDVYGFGRVIEEALAMGEDASWSKVAAACLTAKATRPADGAALEACILQLVPPK